VVLDICWDKEPEKLGRAYFWRGGGWHPQTGLRVQLAIYASGSGVSPDRTGKMPVPPLAPGRMLSSACLIAG